VIPKRKITNFKVGLKVDVFGAVFFSKFKSENLRWVLFFHHNTNRKITIITGMTVKK